jgi:hypothetical protein
LRGVALFPQRAGGRRPPTAQLARRLNLSTGLVLGAAAPAATGPAPAPSIAPAASAPGGSTAYDGRWSGSAMLPNGATQPLSVAVRNGEASGGWRNPRCGDVTFTLNIQPGGAFAVVLNGYNQACQRGTNTFNGTVQGNTIAFSFGGGATFSLKR